MPETSRLGSGGWRLPGPAEVWRAPLPDLPGWRAQVITRSLLSSCRRHLVAFHGFDRLAEVHDPFILVLNHTTQFEAVLIPAILAFRRRGRLVSFLADWNFALIPGVSAVLRAGETILLVRKPAKPAFLNVFRPWFQRRGPAFSQAAEALRHGRSVGIFPEGTTNRHPTRLLRGFDGAARLSLTSGAPVIPVGIRFPGQAPDRPVRDGSPMELFAGEPLPPAVPTGAPPTREAVRARHEQIMRELARLSGKRWQTDSTRRKHHGFE